MSSAVAIINWNSGSWLRTCIESLLATATNAEILVIDNASVDTSLESVDGFRNRVNFVRNSVNRGFAAAINQAFQLTSTSYVLVLNPDIRVMPGNRPTVLTNSSTPRGMKTWTSVVGSTPRAGRSTSPRKQNFSTKAATAQRHWDRRISFARITATNYDTRASISDRWAEQRFARRLRRGCSAE